ncbi:MAG: divalent-cation tolerance protein CutA [Thermoanaerobaculales bacterium]
MSQLEAITLVMTSVGTEQQAVEISEELITRQLATCVNIVPCLRSIYRWKGKICEDTEYLLLVKTPKRLFEQVSQAIREFHSYELPEILSLPIDAAEESFHRWVLTMVEPGAEETETDDLPEIE